MEESFIYYVYIDQTNDGKVFYVGMGLKLRVNRLKDRNKKHTNVSNKYGQYRQIIAQFSERQLANEFEIQLISEYHTFVDDPNYNGIGCNYTKGGEGCACSEETKQKISKSQSGKIPWNKGLPGKPLTEEQKKLLSEKFSGENNPMFGKQPWLGKLHSEETKNKMRKSKPCSVCGLIGHNKLTCKERK